MDSLFLQIDVMKFSKKYSLITKIRKFKFGKLPMLTVIKEHTVQTDNHFCFLINNFENIKNFVKLPEFRLTLNAVN